MIYGSTIGSPHNETAQGFNNSYRSEFDHVPPHNHAYGQYEATGTWAEAVKGTGSLVEDALVEYIQSDLIYQVSTVKSNIVAKIMIIPPTQYMTIYTSRRTSNGRRTMAKASRSDCGPSS